MSASKPISLRPGDLVAIRTRQRNAHLVGRVSDAHQGAYLVHRHVRGTTAFAPAVTDLTVDNVRDIVHADEQQSLSDGMERLWMIAETWFTAERTADSSPPQPLSQRIDFTDGPSWT